MNLLGQKKRKNKKEKLKMSYYNLNRKTKISLVKNKIKNVSYKIQSLLNNQKKEVNLYQINALQSKQAIYYFELKKLGGLL